jgi:hypothetical protein
MDEPRAPGAVSLMPNSLVNRYGVYFHLGEEGRVRRPLTRSTNLLMAVESCVSAYKATGHLGYLVEDERQHRTFLIDRELLLQLLFLKANDENRYFEILNGLDRSGGQGELESLLARDTPI